MTELEQGSENELKKSLSLLAAVVESTADGILAVDRAGKIVHFNQKFVQLWEIPDSIIATQDDNQVLAFVLDQLKNPEEFIKKVRELYDHPDAESDDILEFKSGRIFERYSKPQRLGDQYIGRVWSFRDTTERRRSEEDRALILQQSHADNERLREEREIRMKFVSTLTHDLRTPLTAARAAAELIIRQPDKADLCRDMGFRIKDAIDRADQMIRDLLDANRIRAGQRLPLDITHCDLRTIAADVVEELSMIHGKKLILNAEGELAGYWSGVGLRRIIENLAANAIKYGTPDTHVTVTLSEIRDRVQIAIHNDGNPLGRQEQESLFEPFHRCKSAEGSSKKGWGLGLTLVRGIAEAHGGKVQVESSPFKGTTFTVELPKDARYLQETA